MNTSSIEYTTGIPILTWNLLYEPFKLKHFSSTAETFRSQDRRFAYASEAIKISKAALCCFQEVFFQPKPGESDEAAFKRSVAALRQGNPSFKIPLFTELHLMSFDTKHHKREDGIVTALNTKRFKLLGNNQSDWKEGRLSQIAIKVEDLVTGAKLSIVNCHILGGPDGYKLAGQQHAEAAVACGRFPVANIPQEDFIEVLAGDFNADPKNGGLKWERLLELGFIPSKPFKHTERAVKSKPSREIDWFWVRGRALLCNDRDMDAGVSQVVHPETSDHLPRVGQIIPIDYLEREMEKQLSPTEYQAAKVAIERVWYNQLVNKQGYNFEELEPQFDNNLQYADTMGRGRIIESFLTALSKKHKLESQPRLLPPKPQVPPQPQAPLAGRVNRNPPAGSLWQKILGLCTFIFVCLAGIAKFLQRNR